MARTEAAVGVLDWARQSYSRKQEKKPTTLGQRKIWIERYKLGKQEMDNQESGSLCKKYQCARQSQAAERRKKKRMLVTNRR